MSRSPFTPDAAGYAMAVLVSFGAMIALLALSVLGEGLVTFLGVLVLGVLYVVPLGVLCAAVGVPLVHLLCRRLSWQAAHVLAAGLVGLLAGYCVQALVVGPLGAGPGDVVLPLMVGISAATGRLSVVRLVPAVRRG